MTHMRNPLHRIECWTGRHFRRANLHEVGVVMIIKHRISGMCETLVMERNVHEGIQVQLDAEEVRQLSKDTPEPAEDIYMADIDPAD